jgi:uncharacterized protein DUF6882/pentapeptide repeat protein
MARRPRSTSRSRLAFGAMTDDDFRSFAQECFDEMQRKQEYIAELLVFESEGDLARSVASYSSEGTLFIEADIVPIGSQGQKSMAWVWAWANPSLNGPAGAAANPLPELEMTTGRKEFAIETPFAGTERQSWEYAAIALRRLGGLGVVRFTANDSDWFFVVRKLTRHRREADRDVYPQDSFDLGPVASHRLHDLSGANFEHARLDGAILRGTFLCNASLERASLVDADLRVASLRASFLNGANLTQANLTGADFRGAEFSRTLLADVAQPSRAGTALG